MTREAYLKQLEDSLFKDKDDWIAFISLTKAAQELKEKWKGELQKALESSIIGTNFILFVENWEIFGIVYMNCIYTKNDYQECIYVEGPNVHLWVGNNSKNNNLNELNLSNGWNKPIDKHGEYWATKRWLSEGVSLNFADIDALAWEIHNNLEQIAEQISSVVNEGLQVFKEILTPSNSN